MEKQLNAFIHVIEPKITHLNMEELNIEDGRSEVVVVSS